MRRKVFILTLTVVMVLLSSFSVFGASMSMIMHEPSTSDTQGYLVISNPDFSTKHVFYWSISPYSASSTTNNVSTPSMNLILNDDSVTFTAHHTGSARVTITRVTGSATQVVCLSQTFTTSASYTYSGMSDIQYYSYSGNVGVVDDNITSTNNYLVVNWGSSTHYQDEFDALIEDLVGIDATLRNIYSRLGVLNGLIESVDAHFSETTTELRTIKAHLQSIRDVLTNVEKQLGFINDNIVDCENELIEINGQLSAVNNKLGAIHTTLGSIDDTTKSIESISGKILGYIVDIYEALGEESTKPLDDDELTDLDDLESDVLDDDSGDVNDLGQDLTFGNAFDVVWDLISQAWQTNAKVFTVVIMCLTIGVIKLILNR